MIEIPLFPLQSVLFPGTPIALHVFEDRYKEMIDRCLELQEPFGVVLIRRGQESLGSVAEPYPIGCTAEITRVQPLEDGRMNLIAVGGQRFRITSLRRDKPYLVGQVELFPFNSEDEPTVARAGRRLRPWVERYLNVLADATETPFDPEEMPATPLSLACLAGYLLQVSAREKQALLDLTRADDLLVKMLDVYRREVPLLEGMMTHDEGPRQGPFSLN